MRNQASATAKVIAAATIYLHAHRPELELVSREAAELCAKFLSTSMRDRLLLLAAAKRSLAWFCAALERATLPGIIEHYAKRKRTIEREVLARLHNTAISQVYIVGAGFDTLSMRIAAKFPNTEFIELDHPATQAVKRLALMDTRQHHLALPSNIEFRACDLRTTPMRQLFAPCSQSKKAQPNPENRVVIAEGLLMYFTAAQVVELLAAALDRQHLGADSSVCIFSYMEQTDNLPAGFRPRSWLIERWLALKNEPFLWSANKADLAAVVACAKGEIERLICAADFDGRKSGISIKGENLVVARSR